MYVQCGKPDIEAEKPDIARNVRQKTAGNIRKLGEAFPGSSVFGRSDVMLVLGLKPSRASELLKTMSEHGIIEPANGHGKGKYRFRVAVLRT